MDRYVHEPPDIIFAVAGRLLANLFAFGSDDHDLDHFGHQTAPYVSEGFRCKADDYCFSHGNAAINASPTRKAASLRCLSGCSLKKILYYEPSVIGVDAVFGWAI
jgi:hypothetical protein